MILDQGTFWSSDYAFIKDKGLITRDDKYKEDLTKKLGYKFEIPDKASWKLTLCAGTIEGENFDKRSD